MRRGNIVIVILERRVPGIVGRLLSIATLTSKIHEGIFNWRAWSRDSRAPSI